MPTYEYVCDNCRHMWSCVMTFSQRQKASRPTCPKCRSRKVHQKMSSFAAVTARKA